MLGPGVQGWRELPVFISSTFQDMHDERDLLARVVFPVANQRLRERGFAASLFPVDLRWGIDAGSGGDPGRREREVLRVCVSEVRRCRPLFLGLLGDRYGWVPPAGLASATLEAAGLPDPGIPLSVTVIEMLAAICADDGEPPILLARQATPADQLVASQHRGYAIDRAEVDSLRMRFAALGRPFRAYDAQWSGENNRFESETFVPIVVEALVAAAERHLAPMAQNTWLDVELNAQRVFVEEEASRFVGRDHEINSLREHCDPRQATEVLDGDDPASPLWALRSVNSGGTVAVVGPVGVGKSALLARVTADPSLVGRAGARVAFVKVGLTPATERLPVCVLLLLAQISPATAEEVAGSRRPESLQLADVLDAWLAALSAINDHALIIVDGPNRLDNATNLMGEALSIRWLPTRPGRQVTILLSATAATYYSNLLEARPNTTVLPLENLTEHDAQAVVHRQVSARHRSVPNPVVTKLIATSTNPRWLVTASELLLTLTADDYLKLKASSDADPEAALRQLLLDSAESFPADLDELYLRAFIDIVMILGIERFTIPMIILGTLPVGIDETTLRAVSAACGTTLDDADIAVLRDTLAAFLYTRPGGEWRFRNDNALRAAATFVDYAAQSADPAQWEDAFEGIPAEVVARFRSEYGSAESGKFDFVRSYRDIIARQLLSLPPDHEMRLRYLPLLLFANERYTDLATALAQPNLVPDEGLARFGALLAGLLRHADDASTKALALCRAARSDAERITVIDLVVAILSVMPRERAKPVIAEFRSVLGQMNPKIASRVGRSPERLIEALTVLSQDAQDVSTHSFATAITSIVQRGWSSLRELPGLPVATGAALSRAAVYQSIAVLDTYAAVAATQVVQTAATDADDMRHHLDTLRRALPILPRSEMSDEDREYCDLSLATIERSAQVAWPHAGFQPADDDFARSLAAADNRPGDVRFTIVLCDCARAHALGLLRLMDADALTDAEAARRAHRVLGQLEEARWHLEKQLLVTPDALNLELYAVQNGTARLALLAVFGQLGSAYAAGIDAATMPNAVELAGWPSFVGLAADTLECFLGSGAHHDPTDLISRVVTEFDRRGYSQIDPGQASTLEQLVVAASANAVILGYGPPFTDVARRFLRLELAGAIRTEPDAVTTLRDLAAVMEEVLLDTVIQPWAAGEPLEPDALSATMGITSTLDGLRRLLIDHDGGILADNLGLALAIATRARILGGQPSVEERTYADWWANASVTDDHAQQVSQTIRTLLEIGPPTATTM